MNNKSKEVIKLRAKAESAFTKTAQLEQALAQIEATLSREENQKVIEKTQKTP